MWWGSKERVYNGASNGKRLVKTILEAAAGILVYGAMAL